MNNKLIMKNQARVILIVIMLICLISNNLYSQSSAGTKASQEMRSLINLPTAGILRSGYTAIEIDILPKGSLLTKIEVAPLKFISIGFSYGVTNFIGSEKIELHKYLGLHAKLKFFNETRMIPSIALGFNSQGKGLYLDSLNRYEIKSPGIYLAFTKNFKFLGYLSFHGQINYSLENKDSNKNINLGFGIEKTLGSVISLLAEYDFALNDDLNNLNGHDKGYLNLGLNWAVSENLTIGFNYINLLNNLQISNSLGTYRSLSIDYSTRLF